MAQQALLLNNFSVIFSLLFVICTPDRDKDNTEKIISADTGLQSINGTAYYDNSLFNGTVFTLFENTSDTAAIFSFKKGKEHGVWKKFYASGQSEERREFDNGRKTGELVTWWENGNKKLQCFFVDDEFEGIYREWNKDGLLIKEMKYKKGHEEGPQKYYYDNGKLRSNYVIIGGRRFGLLGTKNCVNVKDSIFKN